MTAGKDRRGNRLLIWSGLLDNDPPGKRRAAAADATSTGIGGEANLERYIAARAALLHERMLFAAARAERGELDGVEIENGTLYVARTKPILPDAARLLADRLYGMLPRVRVTDLPVLTGTLVFHGLVREAK